MNILPRSNRCVFDYDLKKKRVVRGGAPFSQSVRRRKRRKSRQNDASCFATASRERGSSANPSFASVYGALSISPN